MNSPATDSAGLIATHQAAIWRYLRFLGCDPAEADDLAQETFLTILRRPFADQGGAAAAGYLRTVARNLFLKRRARSGRELTNAELDQYDNYWNAVAAEDGGEHYLSALRECLTSLDDASRRALNLQYELQQSRAQIAAALGYSGDGVKSLVARARAALRSCIERKVLHVRS